MEHKLIKYFSKITALSIEEEKAILASISAKHFKKGDCIFREGQYIKDSFFVLDGLLRQYKNMDGEEVTVNFYQAGQWAISLTSFIDLVASQDNLECLEDSTVVVGNEQKAQELFKQFPRLETVSRAVMELVFAEQKQWMTSFQTDTPEQRYIRLLETQPDIFQKVPQYQIASYIGVKPESLSRIRKRIAKTVVNRHNQQGENP